MKLIVSYTEGDGCTYSCQRDVPVDYESAEKLLCDIEAMATEFIENLRQASIEYDQYREKYPYMNRPLSDEQRADSDAYRAKWHDLTNRDRLWIRTDAADICVNHFINGLTFYPPTIYTVDEWFEAGAKGDLV
jgi:hypothetical protein